MCRVATKENERMLLEYALQMPGNELERVCRKYQTVQRHREEQGPYATDRCVRRYTRADGMMVIEAVLHPDEGERVWLAINARAGDLARQNAEAAAAAVSAETTNEEAAAVSAETGEGEAAPVSAEATRADAATVSAETTNEREADVSAEARGAQAAVSAETTAVYAEPVTRFDRADALVSLASAPAATEMIITIPLAALREQSATNIDSLGVLESGEALHPETCRRLACDAGVRILVEDEHGTPLSVGRRTRTIPTAIYRALLHRDRKCCFPGCDNYLFLHAHHLKHWVNGGETSLANTGLLCEHHHRFVHEFDYRAELGPDGKPQFFDPRGRLVRAVPPPIKREDLGYAHLSSSLSHLRITRFTNEPQWDGSRVFDDLVVSDLSHADDGRFLDHPDYGVTDSTVSAETDSAFWDSILAEAETPV